MPEGPYMLNEHMFNTHTGSVFRVTDKNSNTFALKVFSYVPTKSASEKAKQLLGFGTERAMLMKVTKSVCPQLLEAHRSEEPYDITCDNSHLELLAGLDVHVIDEAGNDLKSRLMNITSSQGKTTERRMEFGSNMLVPYMAGGRLGDVIDNNPSFKSLASRYLAYTVIAAQLVESVKRLHSIGVAHSGIAPSTVYCTSPTCEEIVLGEFGRAFTEKDPIIASGLYATEVSQDSVRFMSFDSNAEEDINQKVIKLFKGYAAEKPNWNAAKKVDWFGLGGTFFYVVSGSRIFIDSMDVARSSSRVMADFIVKSMSDRKLVSQVKDAQGRKLLGRIRDQVAEGLALIDGLMVADRSKRISFDTENGQTRATSSLRANKALMSAIQTEVKASGNTCASFLQETKRVIPAISPMTSVPSFLQSIC